MSLRNEIEAALGIMEEKSQIKWAEFRPLEIVVAEGFGSLDPVWKRTRNLKRRIMRQETA
jgi:hypothetical protein